ncbi:MAG: polyisoprenoid-binding protein [Bacteroidia bacterium]|nr:MAG: polyisoprenoid-binding protein [Bacteroidia bacterium]
MAQWKIDSAHSEVSFKVKHLVVSTVIGRFDKFDAMIEAGQDDFSDAKITFEADVTSIRTNNEQRDGHLKSPDFFDAARFPKIRFESASIERVSDYELRVTGDLTIRGTTKRVTLDVLYNGTVAGFGGGMQVAGFEIAGRINRFDFGLQWNALTETGGVVVSNEVRIEIHAEFVKVQELVDA